MFSHRLGRLLGLNPQRARGLIAHVLGELRGQVETLSFSPQAVQTFRPQAPGGLAALELLQLDPNSFTDT